MANLIEQEIDLLDAPTFGHALSPDAGPYRGWRVSKFPRMADIARIARVTPMTVSRALRTPDKVSLETRSRIEEAVQLLGYTPNSIAGTLRSERSRLVVVIVPTINASIYSESYSGICEVLEEHGYDILLGSDHYSPDREEELVRSLLSYRPAGLILTGYSHTEALRGLLLKRNIPVVETYNLTDRPLRVSVGYSNFRAMFELTQHLIQGGVRAPVFLAAEGPTNDRHTDRRAAFEVALKANNCAIDPACVIFSKLTYEGAARTVADILTERPQTDAIVGGSYVLAIGALLECARQRIAVPDRMAIAGFDDHELAAMLMPGITMIDSPRVEMGRQAADLLLKQIDGHSPTSQIVDIGFNLIKRGTTR
jgi:LacI family transcriptional regulator, gluconate utilization system Gnt-I transcriptional repressor